MKKILFLVLMVCLFTACSSTATRRSFGQVLDDGVISNKLKMRYFKDKYVKGTEINVDTWKGVVSLRGVVDRQEQINRAIELAERQPGVQEVKSYLIVDGPSPSRTSEAPAPAKAKKGVVKVEEKDLNDSGRQAAVQEEKVEKVNAQALNPKMVNKPKAESYDEAAYGDQDDEQKSAGAKKIDLDAQSGVSGY